MGKTSAKNVCHLLGLVDKLRLYILLLSFSLSFLIGYWGLLLVISYWLLVTEISYWFQLAKL